jgi:DNA helicase II / ATP-dependent DNA helicase PcrA
VPVVAILNLCCQTVSEEHGSRVQDDELTLLTDRGASERPLDGLTPSQRAAATHSERRLVVSGPAGSGKTRVVEARFAWLAGSGCRPERIGVLAPSEARAAALRARLEERLEVGYEELAVLTPALLAARVLRAAGAVGEPFEAVLSAGDRLAMLVERIDELTLAHHDFGGRPTVLLASFIRRIDRLKAELVSAEDYARWAAALPDEPASAAAREREFAAIYAGHERMLAEAGARDDGNLTADALALVRRQPAVAAPFEHLVLDDAQELDLAAAELALAVAGATLTVAGDPEGGLRRYRGAGAERMRAWASGAVRMVELERSERCPGRVWTAARAALGGAAAAAAVAAEGAVRDGEVELWRCASERSQAQAVAADIERLLARGGAHAGRIAVLVPEITHEGQAVGVALEERAIAHRLIGEAAFFHRAEIRDVLAWLRLLADPTDAGAVVRALARPPVELRSVDIARCTQIARRRKLDMVSALAAATEAPQVPPEARERIRLFLKLYRAGSASLDTSRPDLYVHRLIERLGLRRQQLFTAQADVVERLRALADFGQLAAAFVGRLPQSTPREFARSIAAVADFGLREQEEPELGAPGLVQVLTLEAAGGLEAEHVYVVGLHGGIAPPVFETVSSRCSSA